MRRFGVRIPTSSPKTLHTQCMKGFLLIIIAEQLDEVSQTMLFTTDEEIWGGWRSTGWRSTSNPYQFTENPLYEKYEGFFIG